MVEISRVLRPGGVFVASTFLKTFSPLGELFGDDVVRPLNQVQQLLVMQLIAFMPLSFCLSLTFYSTFFMTPLTLCHLIWSSISQELTA